MNFEVSCLSVRAHGYDKFLEYLCLSPSHGCAPRFNVSRCGACKDSQALFCGSKADISSLPRRVHLEGVIDDGRRHGEVWILAALN
jgi:hypothetical protein